MDSNIGPITDLHHSTWEISEDLVYWIFLSPDVYRDRWEDEKKQVCAQVIFHSK